MRTKLDSEAGTTAARSATPEPGKQPGAAGQEAGTRTGVNDHAWEREHRHPTKGQLRAIGARRRDAETKLEQHQNQARQKAGKNRANEDGFPQDRACAAIPSSPCTASCSGCWKFGGSSI
ncbi:hypothetical protein SAMN05660473_04161 [Arthrobacter sp. 49Tsu3.1M3]|uniref:hypothetical protein n=1 Tax=Arthrobacter sp. 49Tsu3.1M3 TaxID=1279029 RepID=UPI0009A836D8|nr:hypothetical protein [Arthrobacter sp. 49Tsu3.1M3]SKC10037.1 hypothetical protein SAMN05660473_04161 [Arthrobacter sp. 49Tsu3.1M3]